MAKVIGPVYSSEASGKLGAGLRYGRSNSVNVVSGSKNRRVRLSRGHRRQGTVVSEAARLWNTVDGKGPETTYNAYVGNIGAETYLFFGEETLLEWSVDQLLYVSA